MTTVTLDVDNVSPSFDYQVGGTTPASQSLRVGSTGGSVSFFATAAGGNWLSVSPTQGNTPATVTVAVNPQGVAVGTYSGTLTFTSNGVGNSPQTRNVTLTVRPAPTLSATPTALTFTYRTDAVSFPAAQSVSVSGVGGNLQYSAVANTAWITVNPATGTTPGAMTIGVNPTGLNPGRYNGQVTVTSSGGAATSTATVDVNLTVSAPLPTVTSILNGASYQGSSLAPGEIVALFGNFMGPATLTPLVLDGSGNVTTTISQVRVLFSGIPAPLLYVSATQVGAVVPYDMTGKLTASVWVEYLGVRSNAVPVNLATSAPGIFTANASGNGQGAILNQDYGANSSSNAAARGSVVMVYATGEGQTIPPGVDGRVNHDYKNLPKPVLAVTATVDGKPANVQYYGAAPDMVSGLMQVNVEIPATVSTGAVPIVITVGSASSQTGITVAVR